MKIYFREFMAHIKSGFYILLITGISHFFSSFSISAESSPALYEDKMKEVIKAVKERSHELDTREENIRIEERGLKELKTEIDNRITELSKARKRLEGVLQDIRSEKEEGIKNLTKIYENMPPEEAALRIEKLNKNLAVTLLKAMKSRTAGKVLAFIDLEKAAELTQEMGQKLTMDEGS